MLEEYIEDIYYARFDTRRERGWGGRIIVCSRVDTRRERERERGGVGGGQVRGEGDE